MFTNRMFCLLMIFAITMVTACTPQTAATNATSAPVAASVQDQPVMLRLAVADGEGRPSDPYVHDFIDEVKSLSHGNITIELTWDAGSDTEAGFETGVIQLVKEGKFDLGLSASRAFDNENITSFQALQAPFLIDNDALSRAVATSDTATGMLDSLTSTGVVGLAMWPEDLRHPFSLVPGKSILMPKDLAGLNVRATPSQATYKLIESLGGTPMMGDEYQAAESGLRQGASLTGTPTATGNVTFFAKYQVLFANGTTFEKLSDAQRVILQQAAVATQKKAIAEHPSDVEAAKAWCADGGSVVLASDEQVAAFQAAVQPIFDSMGKDSLNAEFIAAIRDLKANTEPSPAVEACNGAVAQSSPLPTSVNEVWSEGLPPNGTWTVNLTVADVVAKGVLQSKATGWAGSIFYEFQDGQGKFRAEYLDGGILECSFTYEAVDDFFRITYSMANPDCANEIDDLQWRLDAEGRLYFHVIAIKHGPFVENKAVYEAKPWQKVADQ